jgi:hypothetical protein
VTIIGFDFSINYPAACISQDFTDFSWVTVTNTKLTKTYQHFLEGVTLEFPKIKIVNLGEKNNKGVSYSDTERKKLTNQLNLIDTLINNVLQEVKDSPIIVGIEGIAYGAKGNSLIDIAQATGILKKSISDKLLAKNLAGLFIFSPSELKNAIGAKGNANKFDIFNNYIQDPKIEAARDSSLTQCLNKYQTEIVTNTEIRSPFSDMIDSYLSVLKIYQALN